MIAAYDSHQRGARCNRGYGPVPTITGLKTAAFRERSFAARPLVTNAPVVQAPLVQVPVAQVLAAIFAARSLAAMALTVAMALAVMTPWRAAEAQISDMGAPEDFQQAVDAGVDESDAVNDPWEGFNRRMFAVNDTLDSAAFIPAARAYRAVTVEKQRKGLRNFLANARTPVIFVNDLLQGEFKRAGTTMGRFVINSTVGFGGMGDPAERLGLAQHSEDFGQTLAVWGAPSGPYLVLPFFGPSTLRDGIGAGVDTAIDPLTWIRGDAAQLTQFTRAGVTAITAREPLIEPLAQIRENSLDYYSSVRSFYMQSRKSQIVNGRTDFDDLPDIGEFEEFEELE